MAAKPTVRVKGLAEVQRAFKKIDADVSKGIDVELRAIAGMVADTAKQRFSRFSPLSASGFQPRTRGFGRVSVVQRRRSKGLRPDFGALMMTRALIPAAWQHERDVEHAIGELLERVTSRHGF